MSKITVETTVRKWYDAESDEVSVDGYDEREIEISREIPDAETFVELLETTRNRAIRYVWDEIADEPEWEDWGWYGPYAKGNISLSPSRTGVSWDEIVDHIAEEENVDDKAGIYLHLRSHGRVDNGSTDVWLRRFLEYLADERDVDTSYWTHGRSSGGDLF